MAQNASIFIPDISGYTEFVSRTELDHSSHIINELLEVLVESNRTGLVLGEIEGDALLFYRTGDALPVADMTEQAVTMFTNFHKQLQLIERDSICQCGACQTASNLTLKFVVHYGAIQPIRIAGLAKASGIDMIVAHRLLKNHLASREYLLATDKYLDTADNDVAASSLHWQSAAETYPALGTIAFQYALLESVRHSIPPLRAQEQAVTRLGEQRIQIDIAAPMLQVYQTLIDYNARPAWLNDLRGGESQSPIDRINRKHTCYFDDFTVEVTPTRRVIGDDTILYTEAFTVEERALQAVNEFVFEKLGPATTRLTARVGSVEGAELPAAAAQAVLARLGGQLDDLKTFCESGKH